MYYAVGSVFLVLATALTAIAGILTMRIRPDSVAGQVLVLVGLALVYTMIR